jgi:hypothetical protein
MTVWRWFVGQVTRLRRSIADAIAPGAERADENAASIEEPAGGPPEHWVERVRQGAPGLLEPSRRRREEPEEPPVAERVVPSQTEPEPLPDEEPQREHPPPEPRVGRARPAASLLRKVLRRRRSESTVRPATVDAPPAPTADDMQRELHAATRRVSERAGSRDGKPTSRRRSLDDTEPTPTRPSPPEAEQPQRPRANEVVELEPPVQRPIAREERAASPDRPVRAGAGRPSVENLPRAERAVDEIRTDRVWERTGTAPASRHGWPAERLEEATRPAPRQEPSFEPRPTSRSRTEPLSAVEHPWPELPPPPDQIDSDVEATLRAWEHQRRIDDEQTQL